MDGLRRPSAAAHFAPCPLSRKLSIARDYGETKAKTRTLKIRITVRAYWEEVTASFGSQIYGG